MGSGGAFGSAPSFGSPGGVGFLSPLDQNAAASGAGQSIAAMTNRYNQLGLGANAASPTGPAVGATPGIPGSGTTPTTGGSFGAGPTAFQMDVGEAPSTVGGIPAEFEALLGQVQTQDLGQTASSAASAIQGKSQQVGGLTSLGGNIANLF